MEKIPVNLAETIFIPQLVKDYLNNTPRLNALAHNPELLQNPIAHPRIQSGFDTGKRKLLNAVLSEQINALALKEKPEAVLKNIELLTRDNCFTVTTGQQIHPFGGPLLVFHKIADTINLAKAWQAKYPDFEFVPVLWLATDDHDFEEVANFSLGYNEYKWETENSGIWPVGRLGCGNLPDIAANLLAQDQNFDHKEWIGLFERVYAAYPNFAMAMQAFYTEFFAEYGLVVINPDDQELKREFLNYALDDIKTGINELKVNEAIDFLEPNYKIQLKPRRINSFAIINNERHRPELDGEIVTMADGRVKQPVDDIIKYFENNPGSISPNAVMRPMFQETILPNIAYVGGPNELAYWLELKPAFDANNIYFPLLALRNIRIYLPERILKRAESIGLKPTDFLMSASDIIEKYHEVNKTEFYQNHTGTERLKALWDEMARDGVAVDKSLIKFFEAEKHRALEQWAKAEQKIIKSQKTAFENEIQWIENTKAKYFDPAKLVERYSGLFQLSIDIAAFRKQLIHPDGSNLLAQLQIFFLH